MSDQDISLTPPDALRHAPPVVTETELPSVIRAREAAAREEAIKRGEKPERPLKPRPGASANALKAGLMGALTAEIEPPKESKKETEKPDADSGESGGGKKAKGEGESAGDAKITIDVIREVAKTASSEAAKAALTAAAEKVAAEDAARQRREAEASAKAAAEEAAKASQIPEQYKEDEDVYRALADLDKEKYGNIVQRLRDVDRAESAYIAAWQKANPGSEYNPDGSEHQAFYDKVAVTIDPDDWKRANNNAIANKAVREVETRREAEERAKQTNSRAAKIEESAPAESSNTILASLASIEDGIDLDGAKTQEDLKERLEDFEARRPAAAQAATEYAPVLAGRIRSMRRLAAGLDKYDPSNPAHVEIAEITADIDKKLMSLPEDKRVAVIGGDTKKYVSPNVWQSLPAAERAKTFTVAMDDVMVALRERAGQWILSRESDLMNLAKKLTGSKSPSREMPAPAAHLASGSGTMSTGSGGLTAKPTVPARASKPSRESGDAVAAFRRGAGVG